MKTERIGNIEYVTLSGMQSASKDALNCVSIVKQWLPIKGARGALSTDSTMDRWFEEMALKCIAFFKLYPHSGQYATIGPEMSGLYWRELCDGMESLRSHYGLNDVDGQSKLPHSNVRGGKRIKPIDEKILNRIEQAADSLSKYAAPKSTEDEMSIEAYDASRPQLENEFTSEYFKQKQGDATPNKRSIARTLRIPESCIDAFLQGIKTVPKDGKPGRPPGAKNKK
jgi:hypothetical protein